MIPPLLLEVQPHHNVIDMCAAPGSKTAQMISALHAHSPEGTKSLPGTVLYSLTFIHLFIHLFSYSLSFFCLFFDLLVFSTIHTLALFFIAAGMVIANDADPKRAYMLVHQLKRLGSPNFLVTTHEGQFFPRLMVRPSFYYY